MLFKIESLSKRLGFSDERFSQIKKEFPEVVRRLEKMHEYEKILISIGREDVLTNPEAYRYRSEKLRLYGDKRVYSVDAQKVDTYEKYDEKMTKLEFEVNHINASPASPYKKANCHSKMRFLQDLHPHFRAQRLYKYDKYKKPTINVKVHFDELKNGKKYIYTEDDKKIELTHELELQIKSLMKAGFAQQDLLEMIFDFQQKSGFGGYEDDYKPDEEEAIEEARRVQIRALYQRASSHMCVPPFENLDNHNKKRVLKYMWKTKCSLEEAMFSIFY